MFKDGCHYFSLWVCVNSFVNLLWYSSKIFIFEKEVWLFFWSDDICNEIKNIHSFLPQLVLLMVIAWAILSAMMLGCFSEKGVVHSHLVYIMYHNYFMSYIYYFSLYWCYKYISTFLTCGVTHQEQCITVLSLCSSEK